jgi:anti-sigma-K factor RskA
MKKAELRRAIGMITGEKAMVEGMVEYYRQRLFSLKEDMAFFSTFLKRIEKQRRAAARDARRRPTRERAASRKTGWKKEAHNKS